MLTRIFFNWLEQAHLSSPSIHILLFLFKYFIFSVFNEVSREHYKQRKSKDYAYITDGEFSSFQIIDCEKKILASLGAIISFTTIHFLKIFFYFDNTKENIKRWACVRKENLMSYLIVINFSFWQILCF